MTKLIKWRLLRQRRNEKVSRLHFPFLVLFQWKTSQTVALQKAIYLSSGPSFSTSKKKKKKFQTPIFPHLDLLSVWSFSAATYFSFLF